MIVVRRCENRTALADFLLPFCRDDFKRAFPSRHLTADLLATALSSWTVVEFFDREKEIIVGAAAREPNFYVHIYVDSKRRPSWDPHMSLQLTLDIFLSDCDTLYAGIPLKNRTTISMTQKLGFRHINTEGGIAFHVLNLQTRKRFSINQHERKLGQDSDPLSQEVGSAGEEERN